jgi:hypothetical protein
MASKQLTRALLTVVGGSLVIIGCGVERVDRSGLVPGLPRFPSNDGVHACFDHVPSDDEPSMFTGWSEDEVFCSRFLPFDLVVDGVISHLAASEQPLFEGEHPVETCASASPFPVVLVTLAAVETLLGTDSPGASLTFSIGGAHTALWTPAVHAEDSGILAWSAIDDDGVLLPGMRVIARLSRHPQTESLGLHDELFSIDDDGRITRQNVDWRSYGCGRSMATEIAVDEAVDDISFDDFIARVRACEVTPTSADSIAQLRGWMLDAMSTYPSTHDAAQCGDLR